MAGDWIRMRRGLRHNPKVIAIARHLGATREFMNWWSDPVRMTCNVHVTELVTFQNVTRVTVCALLDVWAALNETVKSDGHAAFMTLQDIDDIAEIPGFGEAMESVGWVIENEAGGLIFPNFHENNTPSKSRKSQAKSGAQRVREYRARKAAESECNDVTLRNGIEEKRREEKKEDEEEGEIRTSPGKTKSTQRPDGPSSASTPPGDCDLTESERLTAEGKYLAALSARIAMPPENIEAIVAGKNPPAGAFDAWLRNRAAEDWRTPRGARPIGYANWSADLDRFLGSWSAKLAAEPGAKPKPSGPPKWLPINWREIAVAEMGRTFPEAWDDLPFADQDDVYNHLQRRDNATDVPAVASRSAAASEKRPNRVTTAETAKVR